MANKHCFDPKCLELAEHFLPTLAPDNVKNDLAQAIQDAVESHLLMPWELEEHRAALETRIEEAVAVCSACGVSGSGGLASSGSTVTIRCNKPYCPGGTSANRRA